MTSPDFEREPLPQAAARMETPEVLFAEMTALEQHHCQGIAHGEGRGCAGRGCQPQWAGFPFHAHIDNQITVMGHGRVHPSRERDDLDFHLFQYGEYFIDFSGMPAVADGKKNVVGCGHAEIPMDGFSRMEKKTILCPYC